MFKVIIFVHALVSGWRDIYDVGTKYPSFSLCEAARPELVDGFKEILEKQHLEAFDVQSKCVRSDDEI